MPALEHFMQRQVAQIPYGRICNIRAQRTARINILEKIVYRMPDTHFIPNTQTHWGTFFRIDWIASQIFLIQTSIDFMYPTKKSYQHGLRSKTEPKEMESWLR